MIMKYKDFKVMSQREMKQVVGGNAVDNKNVCVSCSYMNVVCMSVPVSYSCTVSNYNDPNGTGTMDCQMPGAEEAISFSCGAL